MKYEIRNRFTNAVQFVAEIEADENTSWRVKIGLAVKWAFSSGADLRGADLSDADLSGADLSDADLRGAVLSGADLSGAVLSGAVLSGAVLSGAVLRGADLRGAVLRGADLRGADLSDADLRGAVLSGADLIGVPKIPNIHQAVYAAASQPNALDMAQWHSPVCETTHCRAGWVVTLAGEAGKAMEFCLRTGSAAALIYMASDPTLEKIPNWTASNAAAMADMKRRAEEEAARAA